MMGADSRAEVSWAVLVATAADRSQSPDRRARGRVPVGLPVRLRAEGVTGASTVYLRDLSDTGAFVELEQPLRIAIGARVALGFALSDGQLALARGRVVRHDGAGFGVVFDELTPAFASLLGR